MQAGQGLRLLDKSILKGHKKEQFEFSQPWDLSDPKTDHPNAELFLKATQKSEFMSEEEFGKVQDSIAEQKEQNMARLHMFRYSQALIDALSDRVSDD